MPKIEQKIQVLSGEANVTVNQINNVYVDPIRASMAEIKGKMADILEALGKPKFENCRLLMLETAYELCHGSPAQLAEWAGIPYRTAGNYKYQTLRKGVRAHDLTIRAGDNKIK